MWAEGTKPPWACDLHLNVNLQMAYWPAGPTGLYPEAAAPLAAFLVRLAQSGRRVARLYYGAAERGAWVAHGFTDAWASAAPLGPPAWALCVVCGAWAALSLWAAFEYTREAWLLDAAYPLLRDAALFFEGQLRPAAGAGDHADHADHGGRGGRGGHGDGNGTLRFSVPAHSPENSYVSAEQGVRFLALDNLV